MNKLMNGQGYSNVPPTHLVGVKLGFLHFCTIQIDDIIFKIRLQEGLYCFTSPPGNPLLVCHVTTRRAAAVHGYDINLNQYLLYLF